MKGEEQSSLIRPVIEVIEREGLVGPGDRILVALSGGIDSSVLLHVFVHLKTRFHIDLAISHVNYQLRANESERDEDFCRRLAKLYGLPLHLRRVDTVEAAKASGKSIQHAARDLRYSFFAETARQENCTKIALGHTKDDQVETFLMRMVKGTGVRGLSSIPVRRGMIIRPFLHISRKEIERYARSHGVEWVVDSSNATTKYERNAIRHRVIPVLEELNPQVRDRIYRLARDMGELNDHFTSLAQEFVSAKVTRSKGALTVSVDDLKVLDRETLYRVLAFIAEEVVPHLILLRDHVRLIMSLVWGARPNSTISLPSGAMVRRAYDRLTFTTEGTGRVDSEPIPLGDGEIWLADFGVTLSVAVKKRDEVTLDEGHLNGFFDNDRITRLTVRPFRHGDRFRPLGMKGMVKVKDFFISRKIPREERYRTPILLNGDEIVWIVGQRIDDRYKVTDRTKAVLVVTALPAQ